MYIIWKQPVQPNRKTGKGYLEPVFRNSTCAHKRNTNDIETTIFYLSDWQKSKSLVTHSFGEVINKSSHALLVVL